MAIDGVNTTSTLTTNANDPYINPDGILGKDDFMKLLLLELQYQDPTDPMDTEQILSQTSELASLEAADNTNRALEKLSESLAASQQYSMISAIGKTASLGSDSIQHTKGEISSFDLNFPSDVSKGTVEIRDNSGTLVKSFPIEDLSQGTHSFEWNGTNNDGNEVDDGLYSIAATYYDDEGNPATTAVGTYPIESVRFENGEALLKLGSSYVPMSQVVEIY
jgi:flagellar basal-body rod modification protein FlgD